MTNSRTRSCSDGEHSRLRKAHNIFRDGRRKFGENGAIHLQGGQISSANSERKFRTGIDCPPDFLGRVPTQGLQAGVSGVLEPDVEANMCS
jgi:hypothetical protein